MENFNLNLLELCPLPNQNQKSFYGKAQVQLREDGTRILFSYGTAIMLRKPNGKYVRIWDSWSMTTGKHIKAFSGLNKKEYESLPMES